MPRTRKAPDISAETLAKIDAWRAQHPDQPTRADAIQRLLDIGLRPPAAPARDSATANAKAPPSQRGRTRARLVL